MAVTDKELEEQLVAAGEELLKPLPCVEELLSLLDVRHYLCSGGQIFFFVCRDLWLGFHGLFDFCFL